ncbi:hypothetical protein KOI40_14910 [Aestuariicella sp. G3-2]|uniref:hypothetical protein n=1 Tax=Pseudomaricurvus albidus TaxID=2842452 RepID=UPI001C0C6DEE|nr:hypothetical protein [Aestuariicella albida]MBU3071113.1 hypothetical protein [Aestuariicella albida]
MLSMTFRFTTECELTLEGNSYEEIYLQFKDFQHGVPGVQERGVLKAYPPETDQIFFQLDNNGSLQEIPYFKGSFQEDIAERCQAKALQAEPASVPLITLPKQVTDRIPDVYW